MRASPKGCMPREAPALCAGEVPSGASRLNGKKGGLKAVPCICLVLLCSSAFAQEPGSVPGGEVPLAAEAVNVREKTAQLEDKDAGRRLEAIGEMEKSDAAAAKKALRAALKKEKNPHIKARLTDAVGKRQDKDSAAELAELAGDPAEDVRNAAVRALAFSEDETAAAVLTAKFTDEKELLGVRLQAANSLSYHPSDEVFGVFVKALDDANPLVRKQALVSLYNGFGWDKARVLPYIEKMAKDKDTETIANQYLKNLGVKK